MRNLLSDCSRRTLQRRLNSYGIRYNDKCISDAQILEAVRVKFYFTSMLCLQLPQAGLWRLDHFTNTWKINQLLDDDHCISLLQIYGQSWSNILLICLKMKLKLWSANLINLYNFDVNVISFMASEGEFTWSASLSQVVHHSESEIQSCSYQVGIP